VIFKKMRSNRSWRRFAIESGVGCSPTRAAVMTGRYPARLGVTDWIRSRFQGGKIPPDKKNPTEYIVGKNKKLLCPPNALWMELDEITIAEALKSTGYTTCHIGKWHLEAYQTA